MSSVLVVDDDPDILFAVVDACAAAGYSALTASSGEEALDELRSRGDIGLVLLDVQMPGLTGLEVVAIAQHDPDLARVPFVLMTAASNVVAPPRMQLIRKPFSLVQLLGLAAEYLDGARSSLSRSPTSGASGSENFSVRRVP